MWPGIETDFQDNLNGGGGLGYVKNVTYDMFYHENNDRAITITQCYGQKNQTLCNEFPVRCYSSTDYLLIRLDLGQYKAVLTDLW